MRLWVSMGIRPSGRVRDPLRPQLVEVDLDTGRQVDTLTWQTPVEHTSGPAADTEFTCAEWAADGLLLQPTHTELHWVDVERMQIVRTVSHPLFHGVHSATPLPDAGVLLSAAGIDSVLTVDAAGEVAHHHLGPDDFATRFGTTDLRRVHYDAFKPHVLHCNHAVQAAGELWVTCFETRDCRTVSGHRHISLPEGIPHDGRLRDGLLWFTQVHGRVVAVDPTSGQRVREIDLASVCAGAGHLGWCRGIEVVGSRLFVGFTMLRAARHREVLRWLATGPDGRKLPSRVVEVDLDTERVVRQIQLGNDAGGTIYGMVAR